MKALKKNTQTTPQDISAFRHTLLTLTAAHKIICTVVIAVVAIIWWSLLNRLLEYGQHLDYSGLESFGPQTVQFLQRYNPFFWWGVVIVCTLLIIYILVGFVKSSRQRTQKHNVSQQALLQLTRQLSAPAIEVLNWCWNDRRHPITVGDLQQAYHELRSNRAGKIQLARSHAAILDETTPTPAKTAVEHHIQTD